MKKIYILFLVALVSIIACKAKQKPMNSGTIGGNKPPIVSIGSNENSIRDTLIKGFKEEDWTNAKPSTDSDIFSQGFLLGYFNDSWIVLGITSSRECMLGEAPLGKLQDAIDMAGNENNWDPRKLIYNLDDGKGIKLSWSGRVGVSSGGGTPLEKYHGYDSYKTPLHGQLSYSIYTDYKVVFFREVGLSGQVLTDEKTLLSAGWSSWASYIIENKAQGDVTTGLKAWVYDFSKNKDLGSGINVVKPEGIRFGYLTNGSPDPKKYYLGGVGNHKGSVLSSADHSSISEITNTTAPAGKTVFYRTKDGKQILFLTTILGYNIRVKDYSGNESLSTSYSVIKDVILEFDESSYADARSDGWTDIRDIPGSEGTASHEIGNTTGPKTYKVPFVFIKK